MILLLHDLLTWLIPELDFPLGSGEFYSLACVCVCVCVWLE